MKKIFAIALSALMLLSFAACAPEQADDAQPFEAQLGNPGTIRVGISPDYPPFDFYDENNEVAGFDVDMANALMSYIGTEESPYAIEFVPLSFDTIISSLDTGVVDVGISGFTYDPERQVLFSDPYLISAQRIVVNTASGIASEADLAGATMAAGLGTVGAGVIETLQGSYDGIELTNPGDYQVMFEALQTGSVDAVVCDEAVAQNYVDNNDNLMVLEGSYEAQDMSVIIKEGNTELLTVFNDAIAKFVDSDLYMTLKEEYGV